MRYRYHTLDVFTDRLFGGNPLAVFTDARGISDAQMQAVARELNLSETVFLFPPEAGGTRRARIFTPGSELRFAGHPTVGTAFLLVALGEVPAEERETEVVLEEGVGPVPVRVRVRGGKPDFAQLTAAQPPVVRPAPAREELAALLGLDAADLSDSWEPAVASAGVGFTVIPLRDVAALGRVRLDLAAWERVLAHTDAPGVYPVVPAAPGETVRVRMFAPAMGIPEDPATGAAAAALGGYLARDAQQGTLRWTVEQGEEMGRPSTIYLEADVHNGIVMRVRVGGSAVQVSEGTMEIPTDTRAGRAWQPVTLPDVPAPVGAYSRAVRAGDMLFVSGQVPRDLVTGELQGDTLAEQTRAVLENVRVVLAAAGATMDDVVSVTAYLEDIGDWGEFNTVYREAFRPPYPSRTTLGAALHDVKVEISVVARVRS
ncbi:MAG TPA: PhzF family phenazine biosynthesis isomerase [Longimicrobium sp.]|nr:PhzF family phenazine biosynthesis isomerase [Longimicrobium sp.]